MKTAEELRNLTKESINRLDDENLKRICSLMEEEALKGRYSIRMNIYDVKWGDTMKGKLETQGYKVRVSEDPFDDGSSSVVVSWE